MAKKQFIRHLEFYGFPDQNKYAGFGDIDLSDIREKNKEQDEEIQDLEGEKAEKKDLDELSGTVENLIAAQSEVNEAFAEAISGMSVDIEKLEETYDEFAEQISALTDAVDDIADNLEDLSASTNLNIAELRQGFNAYTRYADMEFAHRNNVYTKQEIDDMFASGGTSGYATVEWVEEQGFLTEESGDTLYARIEDFEAFSGEVESAITDLTDAIVAVDEKVDILSAETMEVSNDLDRRVTKNSEDISANTEAIADLQEEISGTSTDIDAISAQVRTNKTNIARCADAIRERATKTELAEVRQELKNDINELDNKKADKEVIDVLSGVVDNIAADLQAEVTRSTNEDRALTTAVGELNGRVTVAEGKVAACELRVDNVESGLTKEIADRKAGDLALIGESTDTSDKDTINGAKKLAAELAADAILSAKTYTGEWADVFDGKLADLSAKTDQELSKFATQEYVDGRITNVKSTLRSEIRNGDETEKNRAMNAEAGLDDKISMVRDDLASATTVINKQATILNAFTDWNGEGDYDDSGNGIIDVMHREIHEIDPQAIEEKIDTLSGAIDTNTAAIEQEKLDREAKDTELEDADIASAELTEGNKIKLTTNGGDVFEIEIETGGW